MTAGLVGFNFARFSYQCKTESDYAKATPDSYSSFTNDLYTCSDGKGLCDNVNNGCNLSQLEWVKKQAPAKGCLDSNEILNCSATIRASSWRSNVFSGGDPCVDLVYSSSGTTAGTLVRTARQNLELYHKYQTTSCAKRFYKPATYTEIKNYDYKYVFGNDTAENNFLVPAAAKLGSNFVFSAIIRDPVADVDANCSPTAYYSNGTRYKNIAAALGTRANVFSICSQNYSPALKIIDTFVRSVTGNSYKFNLEEGSRIEKLVILRNGSEFTPVVGTDVSISSGGLVTFTDGYVKSTDEIILRIERTVIE
jgi:hypothetical protein